MIARFPRKIDMLSVTLAGHRALSAKSVMDTNVPSGRMSRERAHSETIPSGNVVSSGMNGTPVAIISHIIRAWAVWPSQLCRPEPRAAVEPCAAAVTIIDGCWRPVEQLVRGEPNEQIVEPELFGGLIALK